MRVLGISGSLRRDSYNTKLLRVAEELLPEGVELELYDELEDVPPYNEDRDTDEAPLAVARLREAIAEADAVLFATPSTTALFPAS
jgi:chromate reductase